MTLRTLDETAMIHKIEKIDFEGPYMLLKVDGRNHKIDLRKQSKLLAESPERVRRNYVLSPSGYGIHWPEIDEDLSIDGMIGPKKKPSRRKRP